MSSYFNNNIKLKVALLFLCAILAFPSWSAKKVDIYELSLDDNLSQPEIKNDKVSAIIQDYQYDQAVELIKQSYEVELMRNNEVLIATVPAERLFANNDTALSVSATAALKPFLRFLRNPGFYKLMLVMHSDDTGSPRYQVALTRARVNAVYNWFDANESVDFVVPYALGGTEPVNDNNSMTKRRKNRRLEIYIVPCDVMLQQAKTGSVSINRSNTKR